MSPRSFVALILLATTACSRPHDMVVNYGPPRGEPVGSLDIVLNDATRKLSVAVNDQLVVDRAYSRRATIHGVPLGVSRVHIATGGSCEQGNTFDREVEILPGATSTVVLPGPEASLGCMVFLGLYHVGLNIGLVAVTVAAIATAGTRVTHATK